MSSAAPAAPAPAPTPQKYVLGDILFDFDSAKLKPAGVAVVKEFAANAKATGAKYEIAGHTDSKGSDAYNLRLGGQRAGAVVTEAMRQGVPASQMTAKSYGESKPVASNDTDAGRAQNRRVEINPM